MNLHDLGRPQPLRLTEGAAGRPYFTYPVYTHGGADGARVTAVTLDVVETARTLLQIARREGYRVLRWEVDAHVWDLIRRSAMPDVYFMADPPLQGYRFFGLPIERRDGSPLRLVCRERTLEWTP